MILTEEEKKKIEEEEYRKEVREQSASKVEPKKKKGVGCFTVIIVFIVFFGIIGAVISSQVPSTSNSPSQETAQQKELIGTVKFNQMQFHIANQEQRDWEKCGFMVNSKYRFPSEQGLLGAETKVVGTIEANSTYSIGAGELTLKDGTRFNPLATKPQNFSVACENGFGYWEW